MIYEPSEMILTGKTEELGENLPQFHFVYHESYMD
jgi:hypothetical protein